MTKQKPEIIHGTMIGITPIKKVGAKGFTKLTCFVDIGIGKKHVINVNIWHNEARWIWDMWINDVLPIGSSVRLYGYFCNEGDEVEYFTCNTFEKYTKAHSSSG